MAKQSEKNIVEMLCIHGKDGNTKVSLEDGSVEEVREEKLLNEENK